MIAISLTHPYENSSYGLPILLINESLIGFTSYSDIKLSGGSVPASGSFTWEYDYTGSLNIMDVNVKHTNNAKCYPVVCLNSGKHITVTLANASNSIQQASPTIRLILAKK